MDYGSFSEGRPYTLQDPKGYVGIMRVPLKIGLHTDNL